jgi:EpsI family protein
MFFVGSKFSDHYAMSSSVRDQMSTAAVLGDVANAFPVAVLTGFSALFVAVGPLLAAYTERAGADRALSPVMPAMVPGWTAMASGASEWRPHFMGADAEEIGRYASGDSALDVAIVRYSRHDQTGELANSENKVVNTALWRMGNQQSIKLQLPDGSDLTVAELTVYNRSSERVVWYWYDIDGKHALNGLQIKWSEAKTILKGGTPLSSAILISIDASHDIDHARATLQQFVVDFVGPLSHCMSSRDAVSGCGLPAGRMESP